MSLFAELTQEDMGTPVVSNVEVDEAMQASYDMAQIEQEITALSNTYESTLAQTEILEQITDMVTEHYSDETADMYALTLTLLARANGVADETFINAQEVMTFEEDKSEDKKEATKGAVDKVKTFAKNVYASLKIMVTKFIGFAKKWIAKASIVLLKGDAKRKELAKELKEKKETILNSPIQTMKLFGIELKQADGAAIMKNPKAILTFMTGLGIDQIGSVKYSEVEDKLVKKVEGAKGDDPVYLLVRAGAVVITEDGTKATNVMINPGNFSIDKYANLGLDFDAIMDTLEKPAKDLQKQIDGIYSAVKKSSEESMKVVEKSEDKEEILKAKKQVAVDLSTGFKRMSAFAKTASDATSLAKTLLNAKEEKKEEDK